MFELFGLLHCRTHLPLVFVVVENVGVGVGDVQHHAQHQHHVHLLAAEFVDRLVKLRDVLLKLSLARASKILHIEISFTFSL